MSVIRRTIAAVTTRSMQAYSRDDLRLKLSEPVAEPELCPPPCTLHNMKNFIPFTRTTCCLAPEFLAASERFQQFCRGRWEIGLICDQVTLTELPAPVHRVKLASLPFPFFDLQKYPETMVLCSCWGQNFHVSFHVFGTVYHLLLESSKPELYEAFFEAAIVEANEGLFWQFRSLCCCTSLELLDLSMRACKAESMRSVNNKLGSKLVLRLSAESPDSPPSTKFIALDF